MEAAHAKNILIIDDDKSILNCFCRVLSRKGYCVSTAESGEEAKEKLESKTYDAALIDVRLSDLEGSDFVLRIKAVAPRMVKIYFTGLPSYERSCENARKNGDAFFMKPVSPELVLTTLAEKLNRKPSLLNLALSENKAVNSQF